MPKLFDLSSLEKPMIVKIKPVEDVSTPVTINYTKIESLMESHLIYYGRISGKRYDWLKAGNIVLVDDRDVPDILTKSLGKKFCCGTGTNKIFQIAV